MATESKISTPANVFVRIRPLAAAGGHASRKQGEKPRKADVKRLGQFDEETVTIEHTNGRDKDLPYSYMKSVVLPQDDQEAAFDKMGLPVMLEQFLDGYNTTFIAYGQTGTGKTHTVFGSSLDTVQAHDLESRQFPKEWGLFPRAIMLAMEKMKERGNEKVKHVFTANVIELYFFEVYDLLNNKAKVRTEECRGNSFDFQWNREMEVSTTRDVSALIDIMHTNRQSRNNGMNDQSSRSHCIASINLTRIEEGKDGGMDVVKSSFIFVDLAGSERVEKTGIEPKKSEASWEGICTNFDLYQFGLSIDLAVEASRKGKKPRANRDSILSKILWRTMDGEAITNMVVCVSQSEKNGGETWCSLNYGERLSKLNTTVPKARPVNFETMLRDKKKV